MKTLRNFCYLMAMLSLLFTFNACDTEGVYNPSKKIAAIYEGDVDDPNVKELIATYEWDGDLLSRIVFNASDEDDMYSYIYTYNDKKQLTEINMVDETTMTIEYDGKKIKGLKVTNNGQELMKVEYLRDNKKIIGADVVLSSAMIGDLSKKSHNKVAKDLLKTFLPTHMDVAFAQNIQKYAQKFTNNSKGDYKGHVDYEWSGNNISKADLTLNILIYSYKITSSYEFDNNVNPFTGGIYANAFDTDEFNFLGMGWINENNATKITTTLNMADETNTVLLDYTYAYDNDKYPVKVICKDFMYNDFNMVSYYEYK